MVGLTLAGCQDSTSPEGRVSQGTGISLRLEPSQFSDDRTYSVGRVRVSSVDEDDNLLNGEIFNIDRVTGLFDVIFDVPIGDHRRLLVEPLGSGIIPGGTKTESGVALQGLSLPFDVDETGPVDPTLKLQGIAVPLEPYIPANLRFASNEVDLFVEWDIMPPAEGHELRLIERLEDQDLLSYIVPGPPVLSGTPVGRFTVPPARTEGGLVIGFQVRSVNRFSTGAFSDTLRILF
jgi:hypothetical protein